MTSTTVQIPTDAGNLDGELAIPADAGGLVLFAHGSGSSRFSPRNQFVAQRLRERGLSTLLLDLLTADEERQDAIDARLRFDVALLATRLLRATEWAAGLAAPLGHNLGYFGASTGAAAALIAAAEYPRRVRAVVSRGGRPDLAGPALQRVRAPTLFIVGGWDEEVLALNRVALQTIAAPASLAVVPGATHLFEEPGALSEVATLAASWFERHLGPLRYAAAARP